jgi:hypothetical protein
MGNHEFHVDLKWSIWSTDEGSWERAESAYKAIQELPIGESVTIYSSPRKEIRFGGTTISRTEKGYHAEGKFSTEWDHPYELADTLGLYTEDETENESIGEALRESLPFTENGDPGVERHFDLDSESFDGIMQAIDNEENDLLEDDKKAWEEVESCYKRADS